MRVPAKGFVIMSACWLTLLIFILAVGREPRWDQDWRLYQDMFNGQLTELTPEQLKQWNALQDQSSELLHSKTLPKGWYLLSPHRAGQFKNHHAFLLRGPQQTDLKLQSTGPLDLQIAANPTANGQWQWQKKIQVNGLQNIHLPPNSQLELIAITWAKTDNQLRWAGGTP